MLTYLKQTIRELIVRIANAILTDASTQKIVASIIVKAMEDNITKELMTQTFHKALQDKTSQGLMPQIFHKVLMDKVSHAVMIDTLKKLLSDEAVRSEIWKIAHVRPDRPECSYALVPNDIRAAIYQNATQQSAEFVAESMSHLPGTFTPLDLLTYAVKKADRKGLFLEFGVYSGTTINHIASLIDHTIHGFDSFQGLPDAWEQFPAGTFSAEGQLPKVASNVKLHVGWFHESLPEFIETHPEKVSFLHIDSDIYSSARTILFGLHRQIEAGTIIVFDEFFNYPGWENHEYKAFREFVEKFQVTYEYIAYSSKGYSVAVAIQSI
jgi:hypothetical protein